MLNLGSVVTTDQATLRFAHIVNGILQVAGAQPVQASISGCDASRRYRIRVSSQMPVTMNNSQRTIEVYPVLVAVNEIPLPAPVDLTRGVSPILTGNPSIQVIFAVSGSRVDLNPGVYSGSYVVDFYEP